MTARDQLADRIALILDPDALDPVAQETALAVADAVIGMVLPLEWEETQSGYFCKKGYEIKADATSRNRYYVVGPLGFFVVSPISAQYQLYPMTGNEAKAAANAHHLAQILAALGLDAGEGQT